MEWREKLTMECGKEAEWGSEQCATEAQPHCFIIFGISKMLPCFPFGFHRKRPLSSEVFSFLQNYVRGPLSFYSLLRYQCFFLCSFGGFGKYKYIAIMSRTLSQRTCTRSLSQKKVLHHTHLQLLLLFVCCSLTFPPFLFFQEFAYFVLVFFPLRCRLFMLQLLSLILPITYTFVDLLLSDTQRGFVKKPQPLDYGFLGRSGLK